MYYNWKIMWQECILNQSNKNYQWFSGTPEKVDLIYWGRGRGQTRTLGPGEKRGWHPFHPGFRGRGQGETLTRLWGHSGGRGINEVTRGERGSPRTAPGKRGGEGDSSFNGSVLSSLKVSERQTIFVIFYSRIFLLSVDSSPQNSPTEVTLRPGICVK